ncbi:ATP/GTP-binding protein [Streptomyces sp. NBC_00386]
MVRDLRTVFGSNDAGLAAAEAFTNRQDQWQAVMNALAEHLQEISAASFDPENVECPRRNVLMFHGVGGIGKTTLSRKIEATLTDHSRRPAQWQPFPASTRVIPVRIDLARSVGTDFEKIVLSIRLAVAALGRPMPAFDLALSRYWEHNHPGQTLEEHLRRTGSAFVRFSNSAALPEQVQSALGDIAQALLLPGTVGGVAGQITGAVVTALRERRSSLRALADCARLADVLEAEPDTEMLSFTPHLLAWDLARMPRKKKALLVVLLDTFEDVGDRTHRDLERLIQRVVWLMPNALFVITGRNRLQWADAGLQGQLDWTGQSAWPRLGNPHIGSRQILVGDFSAQDCEDYLVHRLRSNGQPLIDQAIRHTIAARSHGLPLHLDLAAGRYLELRRQGRDPRPADFEQDFPALIARTLRDLTPPERQALRAVSLLDAWSIPLAMQAAGQQHQAPLTRLLDRPFIQYEPAASWPYHLHQVIRSSIRSADDSSDDRWSSQDWQQAGQRAFDAVGNHLATSPRRDRATVVACLRQGLSLARDFRLELDWLARAAFDYVSDSVWEPVAPPSSAPATPPTTAAEALAETLSTLARRQHEHRQRTAERLTAVIRSDLLTPELRDLAVYYLAKAHRDLGLSDLSRQGMSEVVAGGGRFAFPARRGLAHLSRLAGDFPTTLDTARGLGWRGRHHRVLGDLWWPHGRAEFAAENYKNARTEAEEHAVLGEAATSQSMRCFALAFTDPEIADDEIELARCLLRPLDLRASRINVELASLLRDAGTSADIAGRVQALREDLNRAGFVSMQASLCLVVSFHRAVLRDQAGVDSEIARLRELTTTGGYAYYVDIAHFMAGRRTAPGEASGARWIGGAPDVHARWRGLVAQRQLWLGLE